MTISGTVRNVDPTLLHDVSIIVLGPGDPNGAGSVGGAEGGGGGEQGDPDGARRIVGIGQATLACDGSYTVSMLASGPNWKRSGTYEVRALYSVQQASATFAFFSGEDETSIDPTWSPSAPPISPRLGHGKAVAAPPSTPVFAASSTRAGCVVPANDVTVVAVEPGGPAGPIDVTDRGDDLRLALDVRSLVGDDGRATFPESGIDVAASFAAVTFPPGVTTPFVPTGDLLHLHVVNDPPAGDRIDAALAWDGSGRLVLQRIVEVGDEGSRMTFDMPVRISLAGQAGGRAFYIDGGANNAIMPIDRVCASDDADRVHLQLGGAGDCQVDSGGNKVIYTYHLTRFGTVASEGGAPPPDLRLCSVRLGSPSLDIRASPGGYSAAAPQAVINSGSMPFTSVALEATPWCADTAATLCPADKSLPSTLSEISLEGPHSAYLPLPAEGLAVARNLEPGVVEPFWLRMNLTAHGDLPPGEMVQRISYLAQCG